MKYISSKACNIVGANTVFTVFLRYDIPNNRFASIKRRLIKTGYSQAMRWNEHSTVFTRHRNKYK